MTLLLGDGGDDGALVTKEQGGKKVDLGRRRQVWVLVH